MKNEDLKFLQQIKETLDEANQNLDGYTSSRLSRARHAVLRQRSKGRSKARTLGLSLVSLVTIALAAFFFLPRYGELTIVEVPNAADWQIITDQESLDFYQEDIAFYEWLSEIMEKEGVDSGNHAPVLDGTTRFFGSGTTASKSGTHRVSRVI